MLLLTAEVRPPYLVGVKFGIPSVGSVSLSVGVPVEQFPCRVSYALRLQPLVDRLREPRLLSFYANVTCG